MHVFIFVLLVIVGFSPIYPMHIAITDENNNTLLPYCVDSKIIKNFKAIKSCLDDLNIQSINIGTVSDCHARNFISLSLKDINLFTQKHAGIIVNTQHIKNAFDYVTTDYENNKKFPAIDTYSIAGAVFLCNYCNIDDKIIKKNLAQAALHNGYTNMVYAYINTLKKDEAKNAEDINQASDILLKSYENIELSKEDHKKLYEDMYTSCAFTSLEQKIDGLQIDGLPNNITPETAVYKEFDHWRHDLPTRLFDMFHQKSIGRGICRYLNIEYTSPCQEIIPTTTKKVVREMGQKYSQDEELFSLHDMYLFYNSLKTYNYPSYMFTHLPMRHICQILDQKLNKYDSYNYFWCGLIQDFAFTDVDVIFLQKLKQLTDDCNPHIHLEGCNLTDIPIAKDVLYSLNSVELYMCQNPLQSETRQYLKNKGYRAYYENFNNSRHEIKYYEQYEIMPRYWPWLKLGSGILFAGCTLALCYYLYKNAQEAYAKTSLHLKTRVDTVRNELLQTISADTVDAYKFAYYQTGGLSSNLSKVIDHTLGTIDAKPINGHTSYLLNGNMYDKAYYAFKNYQSFWNNYTSHDSIWFSALCTISSAIIYGTIATIKQFRRFLYGQKPYLNNEKLYNLNEQSRMPLPKFFEPFLLIETMFGLNKPRYIITIDKEEL